MKTHIVLMTALCVSALARGEEVDPASLYELSTEGSTTSVKAGQKGKLVLRLISKKGAHVSTEAPLKLELKSSALKLDKEKLGPSDAVPNKSGMKYPDPQFEIPFATSQVGKAQVEAKWVFFICTEKLCARQQKTVPFSVDVL